MEPVSSSSDSRDLRQLYNLAQAHILRRKALGTSSTTYCTMRRKILLRVLPTHIVLRFHEGLKASRLSAGASSNELVDSTSHTGQPDQELQLLLEFFQNQLMCREAVAENAAQKIHCTSEDGPKGNHLRDVPKKLCATRLSERPEAVLFCHSGKHSADACYSRNRAYHAKRRCSSKP